MLLVGSRGDFDETRKVEIETENEDVSNLWNNIFELSWKNLFEAVSSSTKENFNQLELFARHTSS